jgi:hypothetical protein
MTPRLLTICVASLALRSLSAQPATETASIFKSPSALTSALTLASATLRMEQLLGRVSEQQRLAQMASLAATWTQTAPTASDLAAWSRRFEAAGASFFEALDTAAQRSPDPARAVRTLARARADLGYRRGANGDLTRPLSDAVSILDWGHPQARYAAAFQGVDPEVQGWIAASIGNLQLPIPPKPGPAPVIASPPPVSIQNRPIPIAFLGANLAAGRPTRTSSRSDWSTPGEQGAVDGVKNGMFGFHTDNQANPWWEVDLQQTAALREIRVFNYRENAVVAERSRTLRALVSADSSNWTLVHDQGGRPFGQDGRPLSIPLNGVPARWVRLQLNEANWLALDEVEVYGGAARPPDAISGVAAPPTGGLFVREDSTTRGNWRNVYGGEGALVVGDDPALPAWASVKFSGANVYTWAQTTEDQRAPLNRAGGRVASGYYSGGVFDIDVNLADDRAHQVALYAVDWDNYGGGRSQRVEVLDPATGAVLDARVLSAFQNGKYLVWNLRGAVRLRVTNVNTSANTVVNALFVGSPLQ